MCALFAPIQNVVNTGVEAIDGQKETVWQLNWARVLEPPAGSNLRSKNGKRLWFPVTVRDCTGALSMYIQESAALALSGFTDADQFETAFEAGNVWFPQIASAKIVRELKKQQCCAACGPSRRSHC